MFDHLLRVTSRGYSDKNSHLSRIHIGRGTANIFRLSKEVRNNKYKMINEVTDYKIKQDFINHLPEWLKDKQKEYDVYFLTITFENCRYKASKGHYEQFFRYFRMKLDQLTMARPQDSPNTVSVLIILPEISHQKVLHMSNRCDHYHGFVCLHKANHRRFYRKCVSGFLKEQRSENVHTQLIDQLINPYPRTFFENAGNEFSLPSQFILQVSDYRLYKIETEADVEKISSYSAKNILKSDFRYDDVIIESR